MHPYVSPFLPAPAGPSEVDSAPDDTFAGDATPAAGIAPRSMSAPVETPSARPPHVASARAPGPGRRRDLALVLTAAVLSAGLASTATSVIDRAATTPTTGSATASTSAATAVTAGTTILAGTATGSVAAAASVGPAVVTITTTSAQQAGPFATGGGVGSGFVYAADGWILTNAHVVEGAGTVTVTLADGRTFDGTVVASDTAADLAVVKVAATGLPTATIGSSSGLAVGTTVIAVGDPLGEYAGSVTIGVVSGLDRAITVADQQSRATRDLSGVIQTDAAINEGNSGGPLVDLAGHVVGIVTAGSTSAEGIGFAIPIDAAVSIIARAGGIATQG